MTRDFTIIFAKLSEQQNSCSADRSEGLGRVSFRVSESETSEMRELDELRRFANEIAEPEPTYFTLT